MVEGGARLKVVVVGFAYRDLLTINEIRRGRRNLAGLASNRAPALSSPAR